MTPDLLKDHVLRDAPLSFDCAPLADPVSGGLAWRILNPGPGVFEGVARLRVCLPGAFRAPWFLIPGCFYGENRRPDQQGHKRYARFDPACAVPADMTARAWDLAADRCAAPLVYAHEGNRWLAVSAAPHYESAGRADSDDPEPQVGIGFGHDGRSGYIRFSIPACEEPFAHTNGPDVGPVINRIRLGPGASISGRIRIQQGEGGRHAYQSVLEGYHATEGARFEPAPLPEVAPLAADAAAGLLAHYHEPGNYFIYSRPYDPVIEQIANARGVTSEWHQMMTGFVGGFPVCLALLRAHALTGSAEARRVAERVAGRICREGISPSGLFWADFTPRTVATPNGEFPNPLFAPGRNEWGSGWLGGTTRVHSRTISDACHHLALMILEHPDGLASPAVAEWRRALEGNLAAALDLQLPGGSYGQYYDAVERRVVKADGCGGLAWINVMLKALKLGVGGAALARRMESSIRAAAAAYAPYVEAESIWGAPEDNDSPTSEDGMNAVVAYADLYAHTGEAAHLRLARTAADWMLTFRKAYNQILPPQSLMGRYGMRSKGGDYASASNSHLHVFEVLCTRQLCELSRWTGNPYYRDRARDHWGFVCQHLSRCDGMFNGFRGAAAEQFYWCNFGSWGPWRPPAYHHQKGNMAPFTAVWCIAVILLAAPDALREFQA